MCTAATYKTKDFYMGRTLDYEFSYGEEITITPRNYEFDFRHAGKLKTHYAIIGMAYVAGGYPLYYDAVNEKGVGMAGLNFVGNAAYEKVILDDESDAIQVAQFEFIPWILSQCSSVIEARTKLSQMRLTGTPFSGTASMQAQLHWIIADKDNCIVVESMKDGRIYMIIRLEFSLTTLRFLCRCLSLIIMPECQENSRKAHLQKYLSLMYTAEVWAEWEYLATFQVSHALLKLHLQNLTQYREVVRLRV